MVRAIGTATRSQRSQRAHSAVACMALAWRSLLLASFGAAAQRVEGDRARAEGIYAAEVPGQRPGRGRAQYRLRARRWRRCWASSPATAARPRGRASARNCAAPRTTSKSYDYRQDEGARPTGAPTLPHHPGDPLRRGRGQRARRHPRPAGLAAAAAQAGAVAGDRRRQRPAPGRPAAGERGPSGAESRASSAATSSACRPATPPSRPRSARSGAATAPPSRAPRRATARRCS